jgi:hypothetical protein
VPRVVPCLERHAGRRLRSCLLGGTGLAGVSLRAAVPAPPTWRDRLGGLPYLPAAIAHRPHVLRGHGPDLVRSEKRTKPGRAGSWDQTCRSAHRRTTDASRCRCSRPCSKRCVRALEAGFRKLSGSTLGRDRAAQKEIRESLKPEVRKLAVEHADDRATYLRATFALYSEHGVNPLSPRVLAWLILPPVLIHMIPVWLSPLRQSIPHRLAGIVVVVDRPGEELQPPALAVADET